MLVTLVLAKDYVPSYLLFPTGLLYTYNDVFTNMRGYNYTRIFGQEFFWTFFFSAIFLALRDQAYFQKTNVLVKALVLCYVQSFCFQFCFGAGACLNPALGLCQSVYGYICYSYKISDLQPNPYMAVSWVYIFAPFAGAIAAALFNTWHQATTLQVEEELERHHNQKLSESRSVDKIDVEDTRSQQSEILSQKQ